MSCNNQKTAAQYKHTSIGISTTGSDDGGAVTGEEGATGYNPAQLIAQYNVVKQRTIKSASGAGEDRLWPLICHFELMRPLKLNS
jgi:hypothetical protein